LALRSGDAAGTAIAIDGAVLDSAGIISDIQRIRVFHGSQLLNDIDSYGNLMNLLFSAQCSTDLMTNKYAILMGSNGSGAGRSLNAAAVDGPLEVAGFNQPKRVAALAYGPLVEEQWGMESRKVDFFDLKADLEMLFAPKVLKFITSTHPALHPGRAASVWLNNKEIGLIGELHPRLQQELELPHSPVIFEINAIALQERDVPLYSEISKFPAVVRDLALVVKQSVNVQSIIDTFVDQSKTNAVCRFMQHIVFFDEYRGKGLEIDEKSLAFRITMQDTESTLQDESVEAAMAVFIDSVQKKHQAKLRQ
jgi:phenylalanyl-tRNA synthetase beta chain